MNTKIGLMVSGVMFFAAVAEAKVVKQTTPFDLSVVAPVTSIAKGDASAKAFASSLLKDAAALASADLSKPLQVSGSTVLSIDPAKIDLATSSAVRLYFAAEAADFKNSLGYNNAGASVNSGNPKLAFLNASMPAPLTSGDYVNLGTFSAGTNLDFFVIANGASNLNYTSPANLNQVFSTDKTANADGLQHVLAYAVKDSPYLILTFEDTLGGGDKDYNDVILVADIGAANVQRFFGAPEPSLLLALGSFSMILMTVAGRRRS